MHFTEMASFVIIGFMLLMLYSCNAAGESEAIPPYGGGCNCCSRIDVLAKGTYIGYTLLLQINT